MDKRDDSPVHPPDLRLPDGTPGFFCPSCETPLHYEESKATERGATPAELADYYRCPAGCGTYEYERHRHRLRLIEPGYTTDTKI